MRLASVLTPLDSHNLTLAAQCGVEDVVVRYPGPNAEELSRLRLMVESYGLHLGIVEGYLPMENIKLGHPDSAQQVEQMKVLIRNMGREGVGVLCYHFMPTVDWVRTRVDATERGRALVTEFNVAALPEKTPSRVYSADELWANLEGFLRDLLPTAEKAGVSLAMHPDDPPLVEMHGSGRIMNSVENFERLVRLVPSEANGICFCQGSFAAMGVDIPATIQRLGSSIRYVHFRDVRGTREHFMETFHDNGPTDMVAAMAAYRDAGFNGPMRPDHVPQLVGEEKGETGYTMMGRLFAYGYMRALMQATEPGRRFR
jgi:mannonate dehydratase